MGNELFTTDTFWSSIKRRDSLGLLALLFDAFGEKASLNVVKSKTRITDAAIKEIRENLGKEVETEAETEAGPENLTYADADVEQDIEETEDNELVSLSKELEKAISKGKKKKAKKLFKELKALGLNGSEMDKIEDKIKSMKKDK